MDLDSGRWERTPLRSLLQIKFKQGAFGMLGVEKWRDKKIIVCGSLSHSVCRNWKQVYLRKGHDESGCQCFGMVLICLIFSAGVSRIGKHKVKKMKIRIPRKRLLPSSALQTPDFLLSQNDFKTATIFTFLTHICVLPLPPFEK